MTIREQRDFDELKRYIYYLECPIAETRSIAAKAEIAYRYAIKFIDGKGLRAEFEEQFTPVVPNAE